MAKVLFWISAFLIIYIYFGYPFVLIILTKLGISRKIKRKNIIPFVTLLIAAYNEERSIRAKIENSLALNYPEGKLQIIVASDASTDRTNSIVQEYADRGVILNCSPQRVGKTSVQNLTVPLAQGEIIVFSDATGIYAKDTIKNLVRNFADNKVGCVIGKLSYRDSKEGSIRVGTKFYLRYEFFLREKESELGALCMGSGSIFAIRKNLYEPLNSNVGDDFVIPLNIIQKGYRVIWEPEAISVDEMLSSVMEHFKMKVRVIAKDMRGLFLKWQLLNPFNYPLVSLSLLSHKLLRWLTIYFLFIIFFCNLHIAKGSMFYSVILYIQFLFYFLAICGSILNIWKKRIKMLYLPCYFCTTNLAALIGSLLFFTGHKIKQWVPSR